MNKFSDADQEDNSPTRRDDLLHKRNLEHYNEKFRKIKAIGKINFNMNAMIIDMNGEEGINN